MKTTISIEDDDATINPAYPWTANAYDENGETLSDPGFGLSRREAVLELLDRLGLEMPGFSEPLLPQLNEGQTAMVGQARLLMAQNKGTSETQRTYCRAIVDLVADAISIEGVSDGDDHYMLVERMLAS